MAFASLAVIALSRGDFLQCPCVCNNAILRRRQHSKSTKLEISKRSANGQQRSAKFGHCIIPKGQRLIGQPSSKHIKVRTLYHTEGSRINRSTEPEQRCESFQCDNGECPLIRQYSHRQSFDPWTCRRMDIARSESVCPVGADKNSLHSFRVVVVFSTRAIDPHVRYSYCLGPVSSTRAIDPHVRSSCCLKTCVFDPCD